MAQRTRGLTATEKALLKALIDADQPFPLEYRSRLFANPNRTELIWPGKSDTTDQLPPSDSRTIERVGPFPPPPAPPPISGEGSTPPPIQPQSSVLGPQSSFAWRNRLVLGDNLALLRHLTGGAWRDEIEAAGGARLIYLDPPFATGGTFTMEVPIGDGDPPRTIRVPAYRDAWGGGLVDYLAMLEPRFRLIHALLAEDGSLYVHCDWRASAAIRLLLDEIFGPDRLVNELVWHYGLGNGGGRRAFARKHDTILFYAKSDRYCFNRQRGDVTPAMAAKYRHIRADGQRFMRSYGKEYLLRGGKPLGSVWEIPAIAATSGERTGYPTQKPEALLERVILASSDPGDLVLDLCCGSGTTLAVAGRLGRRWLGGDASPVAIQAARGRLARLGVSFDLAEIATNGGDDVSSEGSVEIGVERDGAEARVRLVRFTPAGWRNAPATPPCAWTVWIDSWAVDFAPEDDGVFHADWEAFRTGRARDLPLVSAAHRFDTPRRRCLAVQVRDIHGNVVRAAFSVSLDPI